MRTIELSAAVCVLVALALACGGETDVDEETVPRTLSADEAALRNFVNEPWTGDLDGMVERGFVRLLTAYNPVNFTYDGVEQRGIAVEASRIFEELLNEAVGVKGRSLNVILIPVGRDELLPGLLEGRGDIAAASLTITLARQRRVAFSDPTVPGIREFVVTGPAAGEIGSFDDLASTTLHVRESSSYYEHLTALNEARKREGKPEIPVRRADERLEDYDLLEMVNAGIIPAVIVDSYKAELWAEVLENIRVHEHLTVHSGGSLAWAVRKDSPQLLEQVNAYVKQARKGTLLGNILIKRYYGSRKWIDNVLAGEGQEKYAETMDLIKRYAEMYDFDWMMIAAQAYQESKLDQNKRSRAGAIGIMQVLRTTAADPNVGILDIEDPEQNVHAGVKYLRFLRSRYFSSREIEPLDQVLFSFAAYNAGPGNLRRARRRAVEMGFDRNRWFGNVEVAAARTISREPVVYVRNIYKYYIAYRQLEERRAAREAARRGGG